MGKRGPIPGRSDDGSGHRTTQMRRARGMAHIEAPILAEDVKPLAPDPDWCNAARQIWDSVRDSAFTRWYEPSDWAVLWFVCEEINEYVGAGRPSMKLASIMSALTSLLLTEGDRRRAGVEIQRATKTQLESAGVTAMKDFMKKQQKKPASVKKTS